MVITSSCIHDWSNLAATWRRSKSEVQPVVRAVSRWMAETGEGGPDDEEGQDDKAWPQQ